MPAQDARGDRVSTIVKMLLAGHHELQQDLARLLDLSDSQITRKVRGGKWNLDDLDAMAEHWSVPVAIFFLEPSEIMHSDQGSSGIGWLDEIAAHAA